MNIDTKLKPSDLKKPLERMFELAAGKVRAIDRAWDPSRGTPVFTVEGKYTSRAWTQWTEGFVYGNAILAFDATDDRKLLELGRTRTIERMAPHVTHVGVHDHGFNNVSTFGNLRRLMREGRIEANEWELRTYEMALKASGAVQAARWSGVRTDDGQPLGYIHSFNGPHSLFVDTMRSLRSLGIAWQLGQPLLHENDRSADLLKRAVLHGLATDRFLIYHGKTPSPYDRAGRTAHEAIFNRTDGCFRCRSTQQGYSPFSTWTRGLAWAMLGFAEQLEFVQSLPASAFTGWGREVAPSMQRKIYRATPAQLARIAKEDFVSIFLNAAKAVSGHYTDECSTLDGLVYWDDGAPGLQRLGDWQSRPADPFNEFEPVDSSASAIAAQGLIRLGQHLKNKRYTQAGLTIAKALLAEPYLSTKRDHQGLLLHSVYHRPNGWDHIPKGRKIPCGESSMWGDYHLLELGVLISRMADGKYLTFFDR